MELVFGLLFEAAFWFIGVPLLGLACVVVVALWDVYVLGRDPSYRWQRSPRRGEQKRWGVVLTSLLEEPAARVRCPDCAEGWLKVEKSISSEPASSSNSYASCRSCGALRLLPNENRDDADKGKDARDRQP